MARDSSPTDPRTDATVPALRCKLCGTRLTDPEVQNEAQDVCGVCIPDDLSEDDPRGDPHLARRLAE